MNRLNKHRLALCAMALAGGCWAQPGFAQNRLDTNVLAAQTIGANETSEIQSFVSQQQQALLSEDPARVSQARSNLIDVYGRWVTAEGSQAFLKAFNPVLAGSLVDVAQPDAPVLSRVNAMLLAARVVDGSILPVIEAGLADENEGVRFQAASAVGLLADRDAKQPPAERLPETVWQSLLDLSAQQLKSENSPIVVQRLLVSMGKLPLQAATIQVIDALDARVAMHQQNPGQSMGAELSAVKQVVLYINSQPAENRPQLFKQVMGVAMKLSQVAAAQLSMDMAEHAKDQRGDLIKYSVAYVFRDAAINVFGVADSRVPAGQEAIATALRENNVANVTATLDEWMQFLAGAPIQLDPIAMRLPR